jgi:hypothetical protein
MARKPLTQGDEDGFCGLYSIVNALSLLFPSAMNAAARDELFKVIAKACKSAWPDVIWEGTTAIDIEAMLYAAEKHLTHDFSFEQPFKHHRIPNFDDFRRELQWRIKGDNCFAIVGISKP